MQTKYILSAMGSILIVSSLVISDTSYAQGGGGEHSSVASAQKFIAQTGDLTSTGTTDTGTTSTGTATLTGMTLTGTTTSTGTSSTGTNATGTTGTSSTGLISTGTVTPTYSNTGSAENNRFTFARLRFFYRILARLQNLRASIEGSRLGQTAKERLLTRVNGLIDTVQGNINELTGSGSTWTGSTGTGTSSVTVNSITVSAVVSGSATISFTANGSGTGYFVALPVSSPAPTATQVRLGHNASGATAPVKGTVNFTSGSNQASIAGLSTSADYKIYFIVETQTGISTTPITATVTGSGSTWTGSTGTGTSTGASSPYVAGTTSSSTILYYSASGSGTGYYVILPSTAIAPTASQVMAGQDNSGMTATYNGSAQFYSGSNQIAISGLSSSTNYVLYFVMSGSGTTSATPMAVSFTTLSSGGGGGTGTGSTGTGSTGTGTSPIASSPYVSTSGSGVQLNVSASGSGTVYYVALPSGAIVPTATQVAAGQNNAGTAITASGSGTLSTGANQLTVTGLTSSTSYVLYLVAKDANGNATGDIYGITVFAP